MLLKASELSCEQRIALESLLGRTISDRETVSVRAFEPAPLPDAKRAEVLAGLDANGRRPCRLPKPRKSSTKPCAPRVPVTGRSGETCP